MPSAALHLCKAGLWRGLHSALRARRAGDSALRARPTTGSTRGARAGACGVGDVASEQACARVRTQWVVEMQISIDCNCASEFASECAQVIFQINVSLVVTTPPRSNPRSAPRSAADPGWNPRRTPGRRHALRWIRVGIPVQPRVPLPAPGRARTIFN